MVDWSNGPIGPGWLMMFAPVVTVESAPSGGGGGGWIRGGSVPTEVRYRKPADKREFDDAVAIALSLLEL